MRLMSPEQPHLTPAPHARRWWLLLAAAILLTQPVFADPPTVGTLTISPNAASPGAQVTLTAIASGTAPFSYQWRFKGEDIVGATNRTLVLRPVQLSDAGEYSVVVRNAEGEQTSPTALLIVDPTFTKVTTGDLVNTPCTVNAWIAAFWADFDGDGDVDVTMHMMPKGGEPGPRTNYVYRNEGDGTFTRLTDHPMAELTQGADSVAWADFDNDGDLDLLCNLASSSQSVPSQVYRNDEQGSVTLLPPLFTHPQGVFANTADWVDYDGDGWLDVFIGRLAVSGVTTNLLFRNQGNGTFAQVTTGLLVNDKVPTTFDSAWADFDNDGRIDLVCGVGSPAHRFYRNEGGGVFTNVPNAFPASLKGPLTYADFDNDGGFDVWNGDFASSTILLFANRGDATFERRAGVLRFTKGSWCSCMAWGDYDNDGWPDVAITGGGGVSLFRNQGNGTFVEVTAGSPVKDTGYTTWCSWVDVNGDGFLDLFVGTSGLDAPGSLQRLYLTNPTTNHWLVVRPFGTVSSRTPVGTKIRVLATPDPNPTWQLRQISASGMFSASYGDGHVAHFGLGDATNVQTLRIEWPSGAVQDLVNVASDQVFTVWEPPALSAAVRADGACELSIRAEPNRAWQIQASADLRTWQTLKPFTSTSVGYQFTDTDAAGMACRFYRVVSE